MATLILAPDAMRVATPAAAGRTTFLFDLHHFATTRSDKFMKYDAGRLTFELCEREKLTLLSRQYVRVSLPQTRQEKEWSVR